MIDLAETDALHPGRATRPVDLPAPSGMSGCESPTS
jgi:hypothetical protein